LDPAQDVNKRHPCPVVFGALYVVLHSGPSAVADIEGGWCMARYL